MSNIGKKTIFLSSTIKINTFKSFLIIKGVFGVVKIRINVPLIVKYNNNSLYLTLKKKKNYFNVTKSMWGTLRSQIFKIIKGVYKYHLIKLKFIGVGYKAFLKKNFLILRLGFSHKIFCTIPKIVKITKIKKRPPTFLLKSFDLNVLNLTSFLIRSFKKPEPYKGKGILFINEYIKLKQGKKTKN
jgi:large subunit ribosomal protein L6